MPTATTPRGTFTSDRPATHVVVLAGRVYGDWSVERWSRSRERAVQYARRLITRTGRAAEVYPVDHCPLCVGRDVCPHCRIDAPLHEQACVAVGGALDLAVATHASPSCCSYALDTCNTSGCAKEAL